MLSVAGSAITSSLQRIRMLISFATVAEVSVAMMLIAVSTAMTELTNCGNRLMFTVKS